MIRNLTDEEFITIVKNSNNISEICKKLGIIAIEGNYNLIKQEIARLNLDTTHFNKQKNKRGGKREPFKLEDIFIKNSTYKSEYRIKQKIIKHNLIPYKCAICECEPKWQGKDLVLVLDHINGDHFDCRLQNLRFVCPNCNSQLDTHGGKNKKNKVNHTCKECGKTITYGTKNLLCKDCYWKQNRASKATKIKDEKQKREIPSKEILQEYLKTKSYLQIGRIYGVTDNAVRRWCKKYGILLTPEQMKIRKKEILFKNMNFKIGEQ